MRILCEAGRLSVYAPQLLLEHSAAQPCLFIGDSAETIVMDQGVGRFTGEPTARRPLPGCRREGSQLIFSDAEGRDSFALVAAEKDGCVYLRGTALVPCNRVWLRLHAAPEEHIYGGGEQFSCFDLRGRSFPIFTTEQGVGRNKETYMTRRADEHFGGGGDYWWTYFPQPSFISDAGYFCHSTDTCYMQLDFTRPDCHELLWWSNRFSLVLQPGASLRDSVQHLSALLGRPPMLPEWATSGIWLGVQGGTEAVEQKLAAMRAAGCHVTAVWCQDWSGIRMTSFGKRVWWDWKYNDKLYHDLPEKIRAWGREGVRFQGYINPYVCSDGTLYAEAAEKGYLVKNADGGVYVVDFTEFTGGMVDFTNPDAFEWYKQVIIRNMIGIGLSGWMADFGEYLPLDCVLFRGDPAELHNQWPALWARLNYEAVRDAGRLGDVVFYMRSGAAGSPACSTLTWAGDQNVDWSADDGLPSVITAALSAGMSGSGLHTSDIGGYTTLYDLHRTAELLLRWAEFAAFTPVMRTHEGNRPGDNVQFDADEATARGIAACVAVHDRLAPYTRAAVQEYLDTGVPVMRPLALAFPQDAQAAVLQTEYMLGEELLCAPVCAPGETAHRTYLPAGEWVHLWTGRVCGGGWTLADAPMGHPPVFYRPGCAHEALFRAIGQA